MSVGKALWLLMCGRMLQVLEAAVPHGSAPKTRVSQPNRVGVMGQTGQGMDSIVRVLLWDLLVFGVIFTASPHFCAGC